MFKRLIAILACGLTLVPCFAQAQAAPSGKVKVSKGIILRFANLQPIDSATAREGDQVPLKLVRSVVYRWRDPLVRRRAGLRASDQSETRGQKLP
jgi:hypothetical protein